VVPRAWTLAYGVMSGQSFPGELPPAYDERYGVDPDHLIGRLVYGVGTRLITSQGASALDGVCKLVAVRDRGEWACPEAPPEQAEGRSRWVPAIKLSETPAKTLNPGDKRVWRVYDRRGNATADLLSLADEDPREMARIVLRHPTERTVQRVLDREDVSEIEPLLVDVLRDGVLVRDLPSTEEMREQRQADVERLDPGVRRIINPHSYHVSLTERLWDLKRALIESAVSG
jgi:nicotinate phosphoribosyltransferase